MSDTEHEQSGFGSYRARQFDESKHPRDPQGRFAQGGVQPSPVFTPEGDANVDVSDDYDKKQGAERYAKAAGNVARDLGFDPKNITVVDGDKKFELNGKTYDYAGAADLNSGMVTLYADHLSPAAVEPTTAHEIMHEKFQTFMSAYGHERDEVFKEPGPAPDPEGKYYWQRKGGSDAVMSPDGTLREAYASKYPLYQQMAIFDRAHSTEDLAKSDGITNYSKDWWKAWHDGKAHTEQAMHETLAEMAARDYVNRPDRKTTYEQIGALKNYDTPAKEWQELYDMVNAHWDKGHKR